MVVMAALYRAFSLTCPASMLIYWNKIKCLHKKRVQLPQDWFAITNMAAVTSCEDALLVRQWSDNVFIFCLSFQLYVCQIICVRKLLQVSRI